MSDNAQLIRAYHARTRHRFEAYAEGPGQLDWDAQPAPFRHFAGAPRLALPLAANRFEHPWRSLATAPIAPPGLDSVGALLELSFGLSAWKSWGPSRWALRCNPSSGNLHPTESYLIARGIPGLPDGLHHYEPLAHQLETLAAIPPEGCPCLLLGLTSIMWRETWKYGERAFRYCQLDLGHALGSIAYAAALLGWKVRPLPLGNERLSNWLGLEQPDVFPPGRYPFTEAEEPEILLAVELPGLNLPGATDLTALESILARTPRQGVANPIDPAPGYRWPVVDQTARASRLPENWTSHLEHGLQCSEYPPLPPSTSPLGTAALIRQRRSGQRYDPRQTLPKAIFYRILDALLPRDGLPWQLLPSSPRIHLALFVERVEGLLPGLYLLPRSPAGAAKLNTAVQPGNGAVDELLPVHSLDPDCPPHLGLLRLNSLGLQELQRLTRALSCHQDIASTSAFTLGCIAEFDTALKAGPEHYRHLLREAGLLGQVLYLEAEAAGVRGTGIGCFFDEPVLDVLGLAAGPWQSLYHFTVGSPVTDSRIETTPPYPERACR